jgi:hypothetical protein
VQGSERAGALVDTRQVKIKWEIEITATEEVEACDMGE